MTIEYDAMLNAFARQQAECKYRAERATELERTKAEAEYAGIMRTFNAISLSVFPTKYLSKAQHELGARRERELERLRDIDKFFS